MQYNKEKEEQEKNNKVEKVGVSYPHHSYLLIIHPIINLIITIFCSIILITRCGDKVPRRTAGGSVLTKRGGTVVIIHNTAIIITITIISIYIIIISPC